MSARTAFVLVIQPCDLKPLLCCCRYDGPTAYLAKKWRTLLHSQALEANTQFYGSTAQLHDDQQFQNVNFVNVKVGYITAMMLILFTVFLLLNQDVQDFLLEQIFLLASLASAVAVSAANYLANNFKYTMLTVALIAGLYVLKRCAQKRKPLSKLDRDGDENDEVVVKDVGLNSTDDAEAIPAHAAHDSGALQIETDRALCIESGRPAN